jgi:hypothetical protein
VLANVSPFLPNQVFFAVTCFATFAAVRLWTWVRAPNLWKGPPRAVALVNLWMALAIALFTVSGLVGPLKPWQPTLHMLEEIGTMGAFCYLAFKVTDLLPTAATSRALELVLKASPLVFGACWTTALLIGWRHPFPMTGLIVDLPDTAFAYRFALLAPGLLYTGLITVLYSRDLKLAKQVGADDAYTRRMTFFYLGSATFFAGCADHLAWSYLQVFAPSQLVRALALPQAIAEDVLWLLMGVTWMLGIFSPYRKSAVDRSIADYRRFLRRLRRLKTDLLVNLPREVPHRRTTTGHLRDAAALLDVPPGEAARGEKVFEVIAARSTGATELSRDDLLGLEELYRRLLHNLPEGSPERHNLINDPLPAALEPAVRVTTLEQHARQEIPAPAQGVQLGYLAATDLGLVPHKGLPPLDPVVTQAYEQAKLEDTRLAF